jgi:hypothetical protein
MWFTNQGGDSAPPGVYGIKIWVYINGVSSGSGTAWVDDLYVDTF